MPPVGFEPTISAVERPQTYALDRTDNMGTVFIFTHIQAWYCGLQFCDTKFLFTTIFSF